MERRPPALRIATILSMFLCAGAHAQRVLSSPASPGTVLDPVSISMQPGFSFSSSSGEFVARIGQPAVVSTPVAPTKPGYSPITVNYASSLPPDENYIYTREYLEPVSSETPGAKQVQSVQFFDGLGRPKQAVSIKSTPAGNDLVTAITYDGFGRQADSWLPVPMPSLSGGIQQGVEAATAAYYQGNGINDGFPLIHKTLEDSPLDRVLAVTQPGNDWQSKPVKYGYDANGANEVVRYSTSTSWSNNAAVSTLSNSGSYPGASLYKNTVTDEDGNTVVEFKDGQGHTVLVRRNDGTSNIDTYYVYNEYDQLAFVIPPLLAAKGTWTQADQDALAYQYRYDGRNRLVEKKLPGKDWEYMVYDGQDRLVSTQDGNMRQNGRWLFTKYDRFGRIAYTGITTGSSSRATEQSYADISGTNNAARDDASGASASGIGYYYSNDTAPTSTQQSPVPYPPTVTELLSVNYYDAYPPGTPYMPGSIQGQTVITANPTTAASGAQVSTTGMPVASYTRNIEGPALWNKDYTYYDTKGRIAGTYSQDYAGNYTRTESSLRFSGKPDYAVTHHKYGSNPERIVREDFVYDHQERVVQHRHQVDGGAQVLLAEDVYNELGQLDYRNVADRAQTMDYSYNIRGWLTGVNDPANLQGQLFGMALRYQRPDAATAGVARYNGNISQADWASQNDGVLRRYDYAYDPLNRLAQAAYSKPLATVPGTGAYNESLTYDLNGNIRSLSRYGGMDGVQALLADRLVYTYDNGSASNRLASVADSSGNPSGYPAGGGTTIPYDPNGNMAAMPDRGISAITYNHLNLPDQVNSSQGNTSYLYRADGTKLKKIFGSKVVEYAGGFQYENGALQFVPTSEGYYDFTKNAYIYNYVDHLGNVRLSFEKNGAGALEILEESNYYPFGLKHEGYNGTMANNPAYNYKYQGQELQETGFYSFKWREYMPDIGRFAQIDPLASKYPYNTPYAIQENKLGLGRELEGLELLRERGVITATGMTANDIYHNGPLPSYMSYLNYKPGYSAPNGMDVADLPSGAAGMGKWNNADGHFSSFAGEANATKALGIFELLKQINAAWNAPGEIRAMGESAKAVDYKDKLSYQYDAMQTAQEVVSNANLKVDTKTKTEITNYIFDGRLPQDINIRSNSVVNLGSKSNIVNTANSIMRQNDIEVRKGPEVQRRQELEQQRMEHQNKLQRLGQ